MYFAKVTEVTTKYQGGQTGGNTLYINVQHVVQLYRVKHNPHPSGQSKRDEIEVTALVLLPEGTCIKVMETIDQILGGLS